MDTLPPSPRTRRITVVAPFAIALCMLSLAPKSFGQWQTTSYALKGGWNAIYLTGDTPQETIGNLCPSQVVEVWRWNSNPSQVQFTDSPLIPSAGTPEWSVWRRSGPSDFSHFSGQCAYLVKCTGTSAENHTVALKQLPLPPKAAWVRNGANLLGFPSRKNGSTSPTFSNYFASFPAVIAANLKIYKYVGGDLGAANPLQVFSPAIEQVDRTKAYWFSAEVGGEYYAPVELTINTGRGIDFGSTGSVVSGVFKNRTNAAITVTMASTASEASPSGQPTVAGQVPLTRLIFDTNTATWVPSPIGGTVSIPAQGSVEVKFGIDRSAMSGASGSLFASFLRVTDSSNLMDLYMPVKAMKSSLAGLWIGEVTITNVSNKVANGASASASIAQGGVTGIAVNGGGFGYADPPVVSVEGPVSGTPATAIASTSNGAVVQVVVTSPGSGYTRAPRITIAAPAPLTGTSVPETSRFRLRTLLHVAENGSTHLLPVAFIGQLATAPNAVGISRREQSLKQDAKATAQRLVAAHLPLDPAAISGPASLSMPGTLSYTVSVPFDDPTNPFVHQYHPDHDNKNARGNPLPAGVESYSIARTCQFQFTATPPAGISASGWGSTTIGGLYTETITGVHRDPLQVQGFFELRRASDIPTLTP